MNQYPTVSVVIPCRNAEQHLGKALDSVLANDYPMGRMEILLIEGRSEDNTMAIVRDYAARHPQIRIIDNPNRHLAAALNLGVLHTSSEIFLRLDAHASCQPDYIRKSVDALFALNADNVGPVLNIVPGRDTLIAKSIALVWAHPLGGGTAAYKGGWRKWGQPQEVPTVPYGCMRKSIFDRLGPYDENVSRSEDLDFNRRIREAGGRIFLHPDIVVTYHTRSSFRELAVHGFANGKMLTLPLKFHKRVFLWKHLAPLALASGLLLSGLLAIWFPGLAWLAFSLAAVYVVTILACSAALAVSQKNWRNLGPLLASYVILHFGYGLGSIWGIFQALGTRRFWNFNLKRCQ
jgi:glycosyltransferase involved in cell wall biosynthesis